VGQFLGYSRGRPPQAGIGQASALEAVESVLAIVRPSADKQGVTLRVEHAPASRAEALRWRARLEQGPLRQVLMNLLLNAIEISPRGGLVRIGVEAQPRRVRLTVSDQGPGIERQERARIFEPFYTTREGGSGLGLAISRQIATSAGGALEVGADPPDGGACFVLTLPRAADVPADESPPTADAATGTQPMQPAGHHGG
jgi:signal transduction histidine kinase